MPVEGVGDAVRQQRVVQVGGAEVDRDGHLAVGPPAGHAAQGQVEHPLGDRVGEVAVLGGAQHLAGTEQAAGGVRPAQERLAADDGGDGAGAGGLDAVLGLEVQEQLVVGVQGGVQVVDPGQQAVLLRPAATGRVVDGDAAGAGLRLGEGLVGAAQQVTGGGGLPGAVVEHVAGRRPDVDGQVQPVPVHVEGAAQHVADLGGQQRGAGGVLADEGQREVVAVDAGDHGAGPGEGGQGRGDPLQHPVAGLVAGLLVDAAEAVEVEGEQGDRLVAGQPAVDVGAQAAAVEQAGERVGEGVGELLEGGAGDPDGQLEPGHDHREAPAGGQHQRQHPAAGARRVGGEQDGEQVGAAPGEGQHVGPAAQPVGGVEHRVVGGAHRPGDGVGEHHAGAGHEQERRTGRRRALVVQRVARGQVGGQHQRGAGQQGRDDGVPARAEHGAQRDGHRDQHDVDAGQHEHGAGGGVGPAVPDADEHDGAGDGGQAQRRADRVQADAGQHEAAAQRQHQRQQQDADADLADQVQAVEQPGERAGGHRVQHPGEHGAEGEGAQARAEGGARDGAGGAGQAVAQGDQGGEAVHAGQDDDVQDEPPGARGGAGALHQPPGGEDAGGDEQGARRRDPVQQGSGGGRVVHRDGLHGRHHPSWSSSGHG